MSLPINIKDLIHGHSVEWERLEFNLTEGRGTGFPKIYKKMENNGSPQPLIETDEEGNYFMVTLPINPKYVEAVNDIANDQVNDQAGDQVSNQAIDQISNQVADQISNQAGDQISNQAIDKDKDSNIVSDQAGDQISNQAADQISNQVNDILSNQIHGKAEEILRIVKQWTKRDELFAIMNISNQTKNRKKYLDPLLRIGWIEMEFPNKRTNPNQRYRITASGRKILKLINNKIV